MKLLTVLIALTLATPALADDRRNASGAHGVVTSRSPDASDIGAAIMEQGGNAVDATIATAFAMAVTYPSAGNIGGGGFMLIHPVDGSDPILIDYREKAPLSATPEMFLEGGDRKNHRFVGVPGSVRGLSLAHEIYAALPWKDLVEPAIRLAVDGFKIHGGLASTLNNVLTSSTNEEFKRVYSKPDGSAWKAGDHIILPDLGATLQRIADHGTDGFYTGKTAELLAAEMERGGGFITLEDLARYRARPRVPIHFTYRGFDVYGPPPPSSGGTTLAMMLQILENYDLASLGRWSPETNHLMIEAMRRGYANRAAYLGDADFIDIPSRLTTKAFAKELAATINLDKATPSESLGPPITMAKESPETTHFSVVDGDGMAVSNTTTLQMSYGSGIVVTGAGFLLNNEMGDFNKQPGITDRKGTIGTPANLIVPEKRMLSSQSPTIVARDGRPYLVTGSPGGRTIINTVLCMVVNVIDFEMDLREAVDAPRTDHEWFPERVRFTGAADPAHADMVEKLKALGHTIEATKSQGDSNSIILTEKGARAAADSSWGGASAAKPPKPVWQSLFDGKTLTGWHQVGDGEWIIEDGAIIGKTQTAAKLYGLLVSDKKYKNLRVKFTFKSLEGNSGFYVRGHIEKPDRAHGLQIEVDPRNNTGGIYESYGRAWISKPDAAIVEKAYKLDDWNEMEILAQGGHVVTWLNGTRISELENDPVVEPGHLIMQMHSGNKLLVKFKDIQVLPLD